MLYSQVIFINMKVADGNFDEVPVKKAKRERVKEEKEEWVHLSVFSSTLYSTL